MKSSQQIWDEEHSQPHVLEQMDSQKPSGGIVKLNAYLEKNGLSSLRILDMCCGKGRNSIWLSSKGHEVTGIDFSDAAIKTAKERREQQKLPCDFVVHDVTKTFPFNDSEFDIVIDCFGSTDIEGVKNRDIVRNEMIRVLKPDGYYFLYTISSEDDFHKIMIGSKPASEQNSFRWPENNKFEKAFTKQEIAETYNSLNTVKLEEVRGSSTFRGKQYQTLNYWCLFQK